MSKHSKTIVSLEAWTFNAPDLLVNKSVAVDVGNLAEALIYYDSVLLIPGTERHFALFLNWFIERDKLAELLALIGDGTIQILHYAFFTAPILKDNTYSIWNINDPIYQRGDSFFSKILYHDSVSVGFPRFVPADFLDSVPPVGASQTVLGSATKDHGQSLGHHARCRIEVLSQKSRACKTQS